MKKTVEILIKDKLLQTFEGELLLRKGDVFYFSMRSPTPKSIQAYRDANKEFRDDVVDICIKETIKTCNEYHIIQFKVVKIEGSLQKNLNLSITDPECSYVQTIVVEEYYPLTERIGHWFFRIKRLFKK